jgi:hypothetical protein
VDCRECVEKVGESRGDCVICCIARFKSAISSFVVRNSAFRFNGDGGSDSSVESDDDDGLEEEEMRRHSLSRAHISRSILLMSPLSSTCCNVSVMSSDCSIKFCNHSLSDVTRWI